MNRAWIRIGSRITESEDFDGEEDMTAWCATKSQELRENLERDWHILCAQSPEPVGIDELLDFDEDADIETYEYAAYEEDDLVPF